MFDRSSRWSRAEVDPENALFAIGNPQQFHIIQTTMLRRQILKAPMSRLLPRFDADEVKASGTVQVFALSKIYFLYHLQHYHDMEFSIFC